MVQVIRFIHALGRLMQSAAFAALDLPRLGIKVRMGGSAGQRTCQPPHAYPRDKLQVAEKNERTFTAEQLAQARGAVGLLNLGSSAMAKQVRGRWGNQGCSRTDPLI